jgi:hypothetical protein
MVNLVLDIASVTVTDAISNGVYDVRSKRL